MPAQNITPPAAEPITLEEAKDQLRLETDADDSFLELLISAARSHVEQHCWRALVTQTHELVLDAFQCEESRVGRDFIVLPRGNLVSITSVKYRDPAGAEQTLATSVYSADSVNVPGRVRLAPDQTWPTTQTRWDAVKIRYVVGWDFFDDVWQGPTPIRQAMLLLISQMYENRVPEVTGTILSKVQFSFEALLGPYRLRRFK